MNLGPFNALPGSARDRALGWARAGREIWIEFDRQDGLQAAAALSFYAFLSIFAMLILGAGVLGLVFRGRPDLLKRALDYLAGNLPGIRAVVEEALETSINRGSVISLVGALGLLYSSTKATDSLQVWMARLWQREKPKWLRKKARSLVILAVFGSAVLAGFGAHYLTTMAAGWSVTLEVLVIPASYILATFLQLMALCFIFSYAVDKGPGFRESWRGALFSSLLLNPLQLAMTWYYSSLGDLAVVYGSLAGVVMAIMFLYYMAVIILLGATLVKGGGHGRCGPLR